MKNHRHHHLVFVAALGWLFLALLAARPVHAAGEQFGRIRGVITDPDGQKLPGVQVTATSPALIGVPRSTFTDDSGRFEIINLPQGPYNLEMAYEGTEPLVRRVEVRQGEASTVNARYALTSVGVDTVAVTSRSLTRPDSTHTGSVREMETLARLPTGRSYQNAAQQVPGVSGGANPNIKGGLSYHNKYLIDGMDVTDPISNTFSMNLTFESMESVEILTGGAEAEYNALGGVINVVPRGGGDEFHWILAGYLNHYQLSAAPNDGDFIWEGEQPYDESPVGPTQRMEGSINIGGPILKRRLWFGLTYQYIFTDLFAVKGPPLGAPPYNIQHPSRKFIGHLGRLRLDWAPSPRHRVRLSGNTDPATIDNTSQSNFLLGVAETRQNQGGYFGQLRYDFLATDNVTFTVQGGYVSSGLEIGPQGRLGEIDPVGCNQFSPQNCTYNPTLPRRVNAADGTVWYQGPSYRTDDRYRVQVDPSVSIRGSLFGRHNAKLGLQLQYLWRERFQETPGGSVFTDTSLTGATLEAGLCNPATGLNCDRRQDIASYFIRETGYQAALFIQDRWWTPLTWLTINPGVRFDWGLTRNWKDVEMTNMFAISPRLGLTADVTRDGRNILFAYYGRSSDTQALGWIAEIDGIEAAETKTYEWVQADMNYTRLIQQTGGAGGVEIDSNPVVPRTDELTGGVRREFFPGTVAGVEYTFKRVAYDWEGIEINRIWDPTGTRVVDYVDKSKFGRSVVRYTTPYSPRLYHGVIFSTEGRPSHRWEYHASHTLSWTVFRSSLSSNERQAPFNQGWSSADLRHYTRLYGAYYLIPNINIGAAFQYRSQGGDTATKAFYNREFNSRSNARSPSGTTTGVPNDPAAIAEFRPPPLVQLDLKVMVNVLPKKWGHNVNLILDVFNVFNSRTTTAVSSTDTPLFGQVAGRQTPLRVQLGLSYSH